MLQITSREYREAMDQSLVSVGTEISRLLLLADIFIGPHQPLNLQSLADQLAILQRARRARFECDFDGFLRSVSIDPVQRRNRQTINDMFFGRPMLSDKAPDPALFSFIGSKERFIWFADVPVVAAVDWQAPEIKPPPWHDPTEGLGPPRQPAISFA